MQVTKRDGEVIRLNEDQIKHVTFYPEMKVVLVNGDNCSVREVRLCKNGKKEESER